MARKQHNEVKAGLFTLAALILLLGVVMWLGAADVFRPKEGEIYFFSPLSTKQLGLAEGANVKFNDVVVAKISRITYLDDRGGTLYVAELLRPDLNITSTAKAEVIGPVIGAPEVIISALGSGEIPSENNPIDLAPGGVAAAINDLSSTIETISGKLIAIADNFEKISDGVLTEPKESSSMMAKIHKSLTDINVLTNRVLEQTDPKIDSSLLGKVHLALDKLNNTFASLQNETDPLNKKALLAKIHTSLDDINAMTKAARPAVVTIAKSATNSATLIEAYMKGDVGDILANARKVSDEALKMIINFNAVSKEAKDLITLNRDNIDEIMDNMNLVSDNLKATSEEIRLHPWKLLHRPSDNETRSQNIYDAARAFSEGAQQLDQAMTKLKKLSAQNPDGNLTKIREHLIKVFSKFHKAEQSLWDELQK